jgi:outer membrane immunogenic protein
MRTKIAGLLAAAIGFGFAQAASAADMPTKAPIIKAPPPIVYSWTGFYGGLNAGVGFAAGSYTLSPQGCFLTGACGGSPAFNPLRTFSFNNSNTFFTGGGQLGYNWQTGTWVLGVETDFNYNGWNADSTNSIVLAAPLVGSFVNATNTKLDWFGTLRGRVGYLVNPALLIYGTGGLATVT